MMETTLRMIIYHLDSSDMIIWVNPEWNKFALENEAAHLQEQNVIGTAIWDHIAGIETKYYFRLMFQKIRDNNSIIQFPYRCDSPDIRRYMEMTITPILNHRLELSNVILREEKIHKLPILNLNVERANSYLKMCSWCKSIETFEGWASIEEAVRILGLFEDIAMPRITHVMCPSCSSLWPDE